MRAASCGPGVLQGLRDTTLSFAGNGTLDLRQRSGPERIPPQEIRVRRYAVAVFVSALLLTATVVAIAQQPRPFRRSRRFQQPSQFQQSQEYRPNRRGVPDWKVDRRFGKDVFTFVRIRYNSMGGWGKWQTDYPDAELNFSYRLQQLTSLHTDPDGLILQLTDPQLCDYPFIYIIEPGHLVFSDAEVKALRRYLLNGGFLMVDDFWGHYEWQNFHREIKRVFPEFEPTDIPLEHPIFHCVYDLKERPQIPAIGIARPGPGGQIITWERGPDTREPHYRGIFDENGRMMAIICHNTDLGDGWEREGEDPWYFQEFSVKKAYPLGINIVFYAMTH